MSVRLVTTPWLTKNFAGGGLDTRRLLGGRTGDGRRRWYRTARAATTRIAPTGRGPAARPRIIRAMLLAVDIGNTNVTLGAVPGRRARSRRAGRRRDPRATADELELLLDGLLRLDGVDLRRRRRDRARLGRAGADRRARGGRRAARAAAPRRRARAPCRSPIRVDRPAEVGADRLVNALAAARLHGTPAVVVDFGTATTFDCVAARRRVRRRGDRAGPRARPRGARGADREAAAGRAARPGPGDRARHGRRRSSPARSSATRRSRRACSRGSARELADANGVAPADVRAILTGGLSAAPWARGARRHRRDRPRPDAQGPGDPPRRGRRRRAARAGPVVMTRDDGRAGASTGRLIGLGVTGSIAAYKAVELLRLLRAEGADVVGHADAVRDPLRRPADVRRAVPPPGRDRRARPAARRPDRPHRRRRHGRRDRRRAGDGPLARRDGRTAWPATS